MAKQVEKHVFVTESGRKITVALLDNDGVRVRYDTSGKTAVTWHATGRAPSITIVTPQD